MEIPMETVLEGCLQADNATRRAAEQYYLASAANPATTLMCGMMQILTELMRIITTSSEARLRQIAAVLLRRLLDHTLPVWNGLVETNEGLEASVKQQLLEAFMSETIVAQKHKLAHAIAEVAVSAAGPGCSNWPELLSTVFSLTQAPDSSSKVLALFLFNRLSEYCGETVLGPHAEGLRPVLSALLQDAENDVRVAAMDATTTFIIHLNDDDLRRSFQSLVPVMLKILEVALVEDETSAKAALQAFIDFLSSDPGFLRPFIEEACSTMLTITRHEGFENNIRRLGLEFMVSLAEEAGALLRKMQPFIAATVQLALDFMCLVDDDPTWGSRSDDEYAFIGDEAEGDNGELVTHACGSFDRLATGVGGKIFWPIISAQIAPLLSSDDWRQRRAALLVISLSGEGCKKFLAPQIRTIIQSLIPYMSDAHPRVRHAAIRCVGQLIRDFSDPTTHESMDSSYDATAGVVLKPAGVRGKGREKLKGIHDAASDLLVPALISALGPINADQPRVQAVAALATINMVVDGFAELHHLQGMERELLEGLFGVIRDCPLKTGKQAAMICVGLLASIMEDGFSEFYSVFVPIAKSILETYVGKEFVKLRGDALHAFSLIAQGVGKEISGYDCAEMLNIILRALKDGEYESAEAFEYMCMAMARMADCLGADFTPYLPLALPLLYDGATKKIDMIIIQQDEVDEDDERVKGKVITKVSMDGIATRNLCIDAEALGFRLSAFSSLIQMIEDLGVDCVGFHEHIPHCAAIVAENFKAPFASLREVALGGIQYVMLASLADVEHPEVAQSCFELFLQGLLNMINDEGQVEVLFTISEAFVILFKLAWESYCSKVVEGAPASPPFGSPVNAQVELARGVVDTLSPSGSTPHSYVVIPEAMLTPLLEAVQAMIESSLERREEVINNAVKNADADEEDVEKLQMALESENDLVSNMIDVVGYCIKTHGARLLPVVANCLGPFLLPFLSEKRKFMEPLRAAAICICDDLVEFASPESNALLQSLIPSLLEGITFEDSFVRHCAAYGIGVCAQHAGEQFDAFVPAAIEGLTAMATAKEAKEFENGSATDNAVAALIKIAAHRRQLVDSDAIIAGALSFLPMKFDTIEARYIHGALIEGMSTGDEFWLGKDMSRMAVCLKVLANTLIAHKNNTTDRQPQASEDEDEDEEVDEEPLITARHLDLMTRMFEGLKSSPLAGAVASVVSGLSQKQQAALAEYGLAA